ncbi:MAG TPA: hypothetical protein VFX76_10545 [Roseiflexaceae bacterium]|nr:hypothetical protein [Roseiflexaceae bacterium]
MSDNEPETYISPTETPAASLGNIQELDARLARLAQQEEKWRTRIKDIDAQLGSTELLAVLLYTEEDRALVSYIREHYAALDKMSGPRCTVLVPESPSHRSLIELLVYWRRRFSVWWHMPGQAHDTRHIRLDDKAIAYDIARQHKVFAQELPCLVFFCANQEQIVEKIVIPIRGDLTEFFRTLFGAIEAELANPNPASAAELLQEVLWKIVSRGEPVKRAHGAITYIWDRRRFAMEEQSLQRLLITHRRRLALLEEKRAAYGLAVEPSIVMEIEDIQVIVSKLEAAFSAKSPDLWRKALN